MTVSEHIRDTTANWQRAKPAGADVIQRLAAEVGLELPQDYLVFLGYSNGGEGLLGVEPGWFQIWPAEQVVELNESYAIKEFLPVFFGFGSSGGGELFAFDIRACVPWPVVMVPFDCLQPNLAKPVVPDFGKLVQHLGRPISGT